MANASFKSYDDVIYNPETKKYEDAISGEVIPDKFTPSGELPLFYEGANHLIGDIIEINRKGERNEIAEDYEQDIEDAAFEAISNGMSYFFKEVITKKILGNGKKQILADYTNMLLGRLHGDYTQAELEGMELADEDKVMAAIEKFLLEEAGKYTKFPLILAKNIFGSEMGELTYNIYDYIVANNENYKYASEIVDAMYTATTDDELSDTDLERLEDYIRIPTTFIKPTEIASIIDTQVLSGFDWEKEILKVLEKDGLYNYFN